MYSNDRSKYDIELSSNEDEITLSGEVNFKWNVIIIYGLVIGCFTLLFVNVFRLQVIEGSKNFLVATRTNQSQTKQLAPRGLIFDNNGVKLAYNVPSYSIYIKPAELEKSDSEPTIKNIATLIGINEQELWDTYQSKAFDENKKLRVIDRLTLKSDLTFDQYFAVLSKIDQFKGVYLLVEPIRKYENSLVMSNILGYIGDPNEEDVKNGIYSESQVGRSGVEKIYDESLRGQEGVLTTEKQVLTGEQSQTEVQEPKPGNNIYLTIDNAWQTKLSQLITSQIEQVKAFAGAGVIMNSKTGEVKALVTVPNYDNNLFAEGISSKDYSAIINNPKQPLFNRPISMQIPPGSVMKIFGATAALESGTINEKTKFYSNRCMDLPGNITLCEADKGYIGWVNVEEAMARSSNIFFCKTMQAIHDGVGYNYYYDITRNYGMGSKTGIDLPNEASGLIPNAQYKKNLTGENWYIGDECNTVIGQGYVTVTPLQMTVAIAAIMNGGNVLQPTVMDKIQDQNGNLVEKNQTTVSSKLNVSTKTLDILKKGLRMGVTAGTAGGLLSVPGNSVGKTGSSDASQLIMGTVYAGAHSWVIGCFDYNGENYCFTVVQQLGGRGYKTVPIMRKFINCVYNNFKNNCDAI